MRSLRCLRASTASSGRPKPVPRRAFTSTMTRLSPSSATMSICPRRERQSLARMWNPWERRWARAAASPAWPTRSLRGRAGGRASGACDMRLLSGLLLHRRGGVDVLGDQQLLLGELLLGDRGLGPAGGGRPRGHGGPGASADGLAALADARPLAHLLAQVVQLGAAHVAVAQHLDAVDARRVQQEGALHADAVGDAADGELRTQADLAAERDDHALEHLDALARSLHDLDVDAHRVPGAQHRDLGLLLLPFEQVDDVHRLSPLMTPPAPERSGRRCRKRSWLCRWRHCSMAAWSPLRSTSGTSCPSKLAGRVYSGGSKPSGAENVSPSRDPGGPP